MTPRIPALPYRKLAKWLRGKGARPVDQTGSHVKWRIPSGATTIVPRHDGRDIDVALVKRIAEDLGLDAEELRR